MIAAETAPPWGRAVVVYFSVLWRSLLISGGLLLPVLFLYAPIKFLLEAASSVEPLVHVALIVAILALAITWAVQWTVRSRFKHFRIQVIRPSNNAEEVVSPSDSALTFGQAVRFVWSLIWRSMIITFPVNILLVRLLFGTFLPQPDAGWVAVTEQFVLTQVTGILIGIWATREALRLSYPGFRFRCPLEGEPLAEVFA